MTDTYTVRPLAKAAWAGPGLTLAAAREAASEAMDAGLRVAVVNDRTGDVLVAPFGVDEASGTVLPDPRGRYCASHEE